MIDENMRKLSARLVGCSHAIQLLRSDILRSADNSMSVLICGPSGSGKELVARALHDFSDRKNQPFVAINCGAIPTELLESELFGHEKGSFTGAIAQRCGRFEEADGGTLFLDEIGEMPPAMQVKLLRVLEDGAIQRVGGKGQIAVNVRIVAATHRDIDAAISQGQFREDLFYRIAILSILVPPLAHRTSDISLLIRHFENRLNLAKGTVFSAEAMAQFQQYDWPGNIRELRNIVQRAAIFHAGKIVTAADVDALILGRRAACPTLSAPSLSAAPVPERALMSEPPGEVVLPFELPTENGPLDLADMVADFERRCIARALERGNGNVSEAARMLTLQRTTLIGKMQKYAMLSAAA